MKLSADIAAVVTGGASGLGEATARAIAAQGAKVTIFDLDETRGTAIAKEIGGVFAKVDVSDSASVAAGLKIAREAHGTERLTVNCAGIGTGQKTVSKGEPHDPGMFNKTISVNLMGTFNVASQSAAGICTNDPIDGERGVIVNTASVAAYDGQIGQIAYSASKGGIVGMTLPMARDLSRDLVRVCTIAPGLFMTPLMAGLPEEVRDSLAASVPHPARLGQPSEFADLVLTIAGNQMLNAEVIRLDGAIRMAPR